MKKPTKMQRKRRSKTEWYAIAQHYLNAQKKAVKYGEIFNKSEWLEKNFQLKRRTLRPWLQKLLSPEFPGCKHFVEKVKLTEEEKTNKICPTCVTANICQSLQMGMSAG